MSVLNCVTERGNISEGKTAKNDLTSFNVHNICVVFIIEKSVMTFREVSTRNELSYWTSNMHVMVSGKGMMNFKSNLIMPLSGCDVCPSEAARSVVKSKNSMK